MRERKFDQETAKCSVQETSLPKNQIEALQIELRQANETLESQREELLNLYRRLNNYDRGSC